MAKTLVALYDTLTDAERVVQELIDDGFARSDVHLVFDHTKNHTAHASSVARDSAYEEAHLIETLTDLGVPYGGLRPCGGGPSRRCPRGGRE